MGRVVFSVVPTFILKIYIIKWSSLSFFYFSVLNRYSSEIVTKVLFLFTTLLFLAGQLKHIQRRFDQLEEELHKKRAELREALRQDGGGPPGVLLPTKIPESGSVRTNGGSKNHRSSVTLELLADPVSLRPEEDLDDAVKF